MTEKVEALRLAEQLEKVWFQHEAAAELRRLSAVETQRNALLEVLCRIAMAAEATVCNQEWVAKTARAAVKAVKEIK